MSKADELGERMHTFAIRAVGFCRRLPSGPETDVVRRQLVRATTGTAANYRASRRARSHAEFTARAAVTSEEADEAVFWLKLVIDAQLVGGSEVERLHEEAKALSAICAATYRTARINERRRKDKWT